ncbi:hypothetical protein A5730_09020 [Mycobacterium sp. ACS4054]|uniref:DUF4190 domain-containing protein n=1 Tax=Mycobacterium sp. ACS4054 TaxID=1834119 RepID=UPI0007FCAFFE|nr:DUF4190 domain-containing protein [Mycobacterium sp. ACS4054]OBF09312.1 hypothetical protein A5730_09020 [Mycobacterium sp. ACS4054]
MTAPGDGFGDPAHDDQAKPSSAGGSGAPDQPGAAWEPPAPDYPPPAYPPPGYPIEYQPGYAGQYPPPPAGYGPPPGYDQPPGYGAPYQPGPSQFGGPAGGYGPPQYPGGYYPAPDYLGGYGTPSGVKPGTNKLAIASLVTSFTGVFCCCVGSIVAIVLGAVAINQIRRTQQDGYGLAVAGIVIGVATLVVTTIVFLFAMHSR